jgi:hypothetical protein
MNQPGQRPLGDVTTVLDLADRDEMDDDLYPLTAEKSWFTRDKERRYLNFSSTLQEFIPKGTAEFGGYLVFELGAVKACDLLTSIGLQIKLGHWFPPSVVEQLQNGSLTYDDPSQAWFYANSLGTSLIAKAEFLLEDQVLETIDGTFANLASIFFDTNTQFGIQTDAWGRVSIPQLLDWNPKQVFPTSNGYISCILPFSFQRIRLRNGFPLLSCKDGTIRVALTLRPFSQCVRIASGPRTTCDETPLGKSFLMNVKGGGTQTIVASSLVPQFDDIRLVTYGMLLDGKLREAALKAPFDRLFREVQTFQFDEPIKYTISIPANGIVKLQLPLEVNGPLEELIWIIRRKAVSLNNEWSNYSNTMEFEYDPVMRPFQGMLTYGNLQVNGTSFIEAEGEFFRREVAKRHPGGIASYNQYIYGYSFADSPGVQNPSGWMNASRSSDVRLRLDIQTPTPNGTEDLEFEVLVYCICLNWVRFEHGIVNKVFSS